MTAVNVTPLPYSIKKRSEIEEKIVRTIIKAFQNKEMDYFTMKDAASYVLDNISFVKDSQSLMYFLRNLSSYWPVFKTILTLESGDEMEAKEKEVIDKLSSYIKTLK